jgi:hypothetical protein
LLVLLSGAQLLGMSLWFTASGRPGGHGHAGGKPAPVAADVRRDLQALMERLRRNRVPDLERLPKEAWSGLLMGSNPEIRLEAIARLSGKKPPPKKRRRRGR